MSDKSFMELVEAHQGFEFCQAYRNDVDHIIGGKGNTYWYIITKKGKTVESFIATYGNEGWSDRYVKGKTTKLLPPGSTINRIAEKAYLKQEEKWVKDRKGRLIEDAHPHFHFVRGIGDEAVDVSEEYGVTIAYNKVDDISVGFHLRYLYTGSSVEVPG